MTLTPMARLPWFELVFESQEYSSDSLGKQIFWDVLGFFFILISKMYVDCTH